MMRKKRIVLCPHCDEEHTVHIEKEEHICSKCGKKFGIHKDKKRHPAHFWHNPDTSHHF
jgi:predicted amidophosphoribosyltransferase